MEYPLPILEHRIPELMEKAGVIGLSISLLQGSDEVWSRGFGFSNRELGLVMETGVVFEAASLTKPLFATLVMDLVQEGLLDLDAPLSAYLPEPYLPDEPRLSLITARRVLCHTPGFPNWRPKDQPLRICIPPGERFSYSGEGYVYLQKAVEQVTGKGLSELLRTRLLEMLGMHSAHITWQETYEPLVPQTYNAQGEPVQDRSKIEQPNAAYSLHCTPSDYARFIAGYLQPGQKGFPLKPETVAEMLRPHIPVNDLAPWNDLWPDPPFKLNDEVSWGLGWGLQHEHQGEVDAFFHWGDNGPFQSFVIAFKKHHTSVVMMSNSQNALKLWQDILVIVTGREQPAVSWLYRLYDEQAYSSLGLP